MYGITGTAERERLMELAREGKQRAWWQPYDVPYATYISLEAEAASISDYNTDVVPGLLQVDGYARALFEAAEPPNSPAVVERHVEARMRRQELLARGDGPRFHCIVDEVALRRPVGGPEVMRSQLERIIEACNLPQVTFQIIPVDIGAHPGLDTNFAILELNKQMVNDVVYFEGYFGSIYLEDAADLQKFKIIFSRLAAIALDPRRSVAMAASIAASYGEG